MANYDTHGTGMTGQDGNLNILLSLWDRDFQLFKNLSFICKNHQRRASKKKKEKKDNNKSDSEVDVVDCLISAIHSSVEKPVLLPAGRHVIARCQR